MPSSQERLLILLQGKAGQALSRQMIVRVILSWVAVPSNLFGAGARSNPGCCMFRSRASSCCEPLRPSSTVLAFRQQMLFSFTSLQVKLFARCLPHFWLSNLFHSVMSESLRLWRRTNFAADLSFGSSGIGRSWPIQRPYRLAVCAAATNEHGAGRRACRRGIQNPRIEMDPPSASRPALEPALAAAFESLSASLHRPLLQLRPGMFRMGINPNLYPER